MEDGDTRFSLRLLDAYELLPFGAAMAGESRSEFVRQAVRERVRRLERETETTTTTEEAA